MRKLSITAALALLATLLLGGLLGDTARAQHASMEVPNEGIYAGLPFVLAVSAEGFEPEPEPEISALQIPGCEVSFLGVSPNMSISTTIVNGRRSSIRRVEFVYRFRVEAKRPGTYQVPAVTVTQGSKRASTQPTRVGVADVGGSTDMRLALGVPERPVWVGETFDLTIDWYLRRSPSEPNFSIPLLDDPAWLDVHAPVIEDTGRRRQTLAIPIGDRQIELPYTVERVNQGGMPYDRFRFTVPVTPIQAGTLRAEPAQVVAGLQMSAGRSLFSRPRIRLFKAVDQPRTVEIKPLPLANRPPSFANAVGTAFSIQVQASRTVVQVGDPVELQILIRGDGRMEGLSLPDLNNPEGLPAEQFSVAESRGTGEIVNDGQGKLFRVTVRLKNAEAREIPRLGFAYFDPERGAYETVYSEPVALSVQGSSVVGAGDVVSAVPQAQGAPATPGAATAGAAATGGIASFVGVDLSLSGEADTLDAGWSVGRLTPLLLALYAVPLLLLAVRLWQVSTRERRGHSSEVRQALRAVQGELDRADRDPAREAAPRLLAALRVLARVTGQGAGGAGVIGRIETESFDPRAAQEPLDAALRDEARALAESWARQHRRVPGAGSASTAVLLMVHLVLGGVALTGTESSAQAAEATIDAARAAYREALALADRDARTGAFARAEAMFRVLAEAHPDRPQLLVDWGNAALGAQDLGRATLAYRRALALDPDLSRAARNLAWVRERAPGSLPVPARERASDSLFFWHHALSVPARHLVGAVAFAAAVLLLAPWSAGRTRLFRRLALIPAIVWVAMMASILLQPDTAQDAVVITDGTVLLSADSAGAPPALPNPLPAGAEVTILETRDMWTRVALANGTKGWVQAGTLERVRPLP